VVSKCGGHFDGFFVVVGVVFLVSLEEMRGGKREVERSRDAPVLLTYRNDIHERNGRRVEEERKTSL